ncbi:glutathione S-transferase [Aspergillus cavernicola]|uniref:Glutathione S-transferase n=1 Tax=Aspergillus cavernicola TaxID=176166 RepID=A0ABR4HZX4_9EURO
MSLTIHHLHVSSSERVVWLCEELNLSYKLKTYTRSPLLAPPELKALHPQGSSPTIQDGDLTLAETGACLEYIARKHGGGRLLLDPSHLAYADFIYWFHWASGTFMPNVGRVMMMGFAGLGAENSMVGFTNDRLQKALRMLDDRLKDNQWLAGEEFTAADIMVVFPLTTMRYFARYSLQGFEHVAGYLKRVAEREGYQRAMRKCDPEMELVLGVEPPSKPFV